MAKPISVEVSREAETLEELLDAARFLSERITANFRLRFAAEALTPGHQGSDRSFYLNWASHDMQAVASYLRLAIAASPEQYPVGTSDEEKRADRKRRGL